MKKKWLRAGGILCLCMCLAGCKEDKQLELSEEDSRYEWDDFFYVEHSEDQEIFCVVSNNAIYPSIIQNQYIIDSYTEVKTKLYDGRDAFNDVIRYDVKLYDIFTLRLLKEIDIKKVLSPYLDEYEVYNGGEMIREQDGNYYLEKTLQRKQTEEELIEEKERVYEDFLIDVKAETVLSINERDEADTRIVKNTHENVWMLVGTDILESNHFENTHVRNSVELEDTSCIDIPTKYLPEKNDKLYSLLPGLTGVSREEGVYAHIFITHRTDNLEVLSLILDDNKGLDFSLLEPDDNGYYGSYRKNGERHDITAEEYEQFQRDYHEYREREAE